MSAVETCHSFCPASETRVYSGSNIDYATTGDGSRYADLTNAYRYRKQLVAGCTCNGRTAFGLAQVELANDPTLRPGDVVATKAGLMAVSGGAQQDGRIHAGPASTLPATERAALAQIRVTPDYGVPRGESHRFDFRAAGFKERAARQVAARVTAQASSASATASPSDSELVSPGNSMPNICTRPARPCCRRRIDQEIALRLALADSFGRMPA